MVGDHIPPTGKATPLIKVSFKMHTSRLLLPPPPSQDPGGARLASAATSLHPPRLHNPYKSTRRRLGGRPARERVFIYLFLRFGPKSKLKSLAKWPICFQILLEAVCGATFARQPKIGVAYRIFYQKKTKNGVAYRIFYKGAPRRPPQRHLSQPTGQPAGRPAGRPEAQICAPQMSCCFNLSPQKQS